MKNILMIALKSAVNAILITVPTMIWDKGEFTIHSRAGWEHVAVLTVNAIIAREAIVWGPVLLKWSATNVNPGGGQP